MHSLLSVPPAISLAADLMITTASISVLSFGRKVRCMAMTKGYPNKDGLLHFCLCAWCPLQCVIPPDAVSTCAFTPFYITFTGVAGDTCYLHSILVHHSFLAKG
ncbi:hypothetical protein HPP92_028743 [Vanilla planifolia]|uniref:Uncharacterized protein n=1 Tax=Vanilla planifolia TaxID=51239 RepID=A0A835P7E4_VANPL|nr:hypothetical protein HPP92_028743 [Vanilla planifolia]KAG0446654.1 hypothetical protein HPP92_028732 [Vanilla planifolia]